MDHRFTERARLSETATFFPGPTHPTPVLKSISIQPKISRTVLNEFALSIRPDWTNRGVQTTQPTHTLAKPLTSRVPMAGGNGLKVESICPDKLGWRGLGYEMGDGLRNSKHFESKKPVGITVNASAPWALFLELQAL